jgi:hypothetical protein
MCYWECWLVLLFIFYLLTSPYFPFGIRHIFVVMTFSGKELDVNSTAFWVVMLCSLERTQRFEGTYCLHLHGWRVRQACFPGVLLGLLFNPEDGGIMNQNSYILWETFYIVVIMSVSKAWHRFYTALKYLESHNSFMSTPCTVLIPYKTVTQFHTEILVILFVHGGSSTI